MRRQQRVHRNRQPGVAPAPVAVPLTAQGPSTGAVPQPVAPVTVGALLFDGFNDIAPTTGHANISQCGVNPSKWAQGNDPNDVTSNLAYLSTALDPGGSGQRVVAFGLSSDYTEGIDIDGPSFTPPIYIEYQLWLVTLGNWGSAWAVTGPSTPAANYQEIDIMECGGQNYGYNGPTYHWGPTPPGDNSGFSVTSGPGSAAGVWCAQGAEWGASEITVWYDTTNVNAAASTTFTIADNTSPQQPVHLKINTGQLTEYGSGPTGTQFYCRSARVWALL